MGSLLTPWAMLKSKLRLAYFTVVGVIGVGLVLLSIHQILLPLLAWLIPGLETVFFDWAVYGVYRPQKYVSFNLTSPQTSVLQWDDSCDNGLVLASLNGPSVPRPGPSIFDPRGDLIWMSDAYGVTMNFQVQRYKDENYLTFWAGSKQATSGKGNYYMVKTANVQSIFFMKH